MAYSEFKRRSEVAANVPSSLSAHFPSSSSPPPRAVSPCSSSTSSLDREAVTATFPCSWCLRSWSRHEVMYLEDCHHTLCSQCIKEGEDWTESCQFTCKVCLSKTDTVKEEERQHAHNNSINAAPQIAYVLPQQVILHNSAMPPIAAVQGPPPMCQPIGLPPPGLQQRAHVINCPPGTTLQQHIHNRPVMLNNSLPTTTHRQPSVINLPPPPPLHQPAINVLPPAQTQVPLSLPPHLINNFTVLHHQQPIVNNLPVVHQQLVPNTVITGHQQNAAPHLLATQHQTVFNNLPRGSQQSQPQSLGDHQPQSPTGSQKPQPQSPTSSDPPQQSMEEIYKECLELLNLTSRKLDIHITHLNSQMIKQHSTIDRYVTDMVSSLYRWADATKDRINSAYTPHLIQMSAIQSATSSWTAQVKNKELSEECLRALLSDARNLQDAHTLSNLPQHALLLSPIPQEFGSLTHLSNRTVDVRPHITHRVTPYKAIDQAATQAVDQTGQTNNQTESQPASPTTHPTTDQGIYKKTDETSNQSSVESIVDAIFNKALARPTGKTQNNPDTKTNDAPSGMTSSRATDERGENASGSASSSSRYQLSRKETGSLDSSPTTMQSANAMDERSWGVALDTKPLDIDSDSKTSNSPPETKSFHVEHLLSDSKSSLSDNDWVFSKIFGSSPKLCMDNDLTFEKTSNCRLYRRTQGNASSKSQESSSEENEQDGQLRIQPIGRCIWNNAFPN